MKMSEDLQKKSDEDLMEMYQNGEAKAFEILYKRFSPQILGYLTKKSRSEKSAQDLAQEVFIKLHRSKHQYNLIYPFAPWLFSITRTVFLDYAKKRNLEDLVDQTDLENVSAPEIAETKEVDLGALPKAQRQAVSMRVYEEATFEEIALKLSTSPENARQLFSRGMKNLKAAFLKGRKE